jgi:hypothetical protein
VSNRRGRVARTEREATRTLEAQERINGCHAAQFQQFQQFELQAGGEAGRQAFGIALGFALELRPQRKRVEPQEPADACTAKQVAGSAAGTATGAVQGLGSAIKSIAAPIGTAVLGTAAGLAIGKATFGRKKKVLGITMPGQKNGLQHLTRNVGEAGKQLGKFADEVREARKKAEEVGKALS